MLAREDFLLENLRTPPFVDARDLENLRCIDIGVGSPAHYGYTADHAFVDLRASAFWVGRHWRGRRDLPGRTSRQRCIS